MQFNPYFDTFHRICLKFVAVDFHKNLSDDGEFHENRHNNKKYCA